MMVLKKVDPLSCGMLLGILNAIGGLLVGAMFSLISLVGMQAAPNQAPGMSMVFSAAAVVVVPVMYGIGGFVGGVIMALFYNLAAMCVGGLKVELEDLIKDF